MRSKLLYNLAADLSSSEEAFVLYQLGVSPQGSDRKAKSPGLQLGAFGFQGDGVIRVTEMGSQVTSLNIFESVTTVGELKAMLSPIKGLEVGLLCLYALGNEDVLLDGATVNSDRPLFLLCKNYSPWEWSETTLANVNWEFKKQGTAFSSDDRYIADLPGAAPPDPEHARDRTAIWQNDAAIHGCLRAPLQPGTHYWRVKVRPVASKSVSPDASKSMSPVVSESVAESGRHTHLRPPTPN
jgi:hypothetical protein